MWFGKKFAGVDDLLHGVKHDPVAGMPRGATNEPSAPRSLTYRRHAKSIPFKILSGRAVPYGLHQRFVSRWGHTLYSDFDHPPVDKRAANSGVTV